MEFVFITAVMLTDENWTECVENTERQPESTNKHCELKWRKKKKRLKLCWYEVENPAGTRRQNNVVTTLFLTIWRRYNVHATSFQHRVSAGKMLIADLRLVIGHKGVHSWQNYFLFTQEAERNTVRKTPEYGPVCYRIGTNYFHI